MAPQEKSVQDSSRAQKYTSRIKNYLKKIILKKIVIDDQLDSLDALEKYTPHAPSPQNVINIFQGIWKSKFPAPYTHLQGGTISLFEDDRIEWALQKLEGVQDKKILELGPFEGGHSYMLQKKGAKSVTSIEGNLRSYLQCLVVKDLFKLDRVDFLLGDFMEYFRHSPASFDICIASGVLYHMRSPVELIGQIAKTTSKVFFWTHYYDPEICPKLKEISTEWGGFKHSLYHYDYSTGRVKKGFCGGPASYTHWLTRQTILDACHHFGFTDIEIGLEERNHQNGPCFCLVAKKSSNQRVFL